MEIEETRRGGTILLRPAGRIDLQSAPELEARMLQAIAASAAAPVRLLVSLAGVDYISSIGLRALLVASRRAKDGGGRLAVSDLVPQVAEIFNISRFDRVLQVFPTADQAAAWLETEPGGAGDG